MFPALRVSCGWSWLKAEHEVLHREFDVHHAAGIVLDVEERRAVRMLGGHSFAHGDDVAGKPLRIASKTQHVVTNGVERSADRGVAGDEARAGQRLVLPCPRVLALIAVERADARDEKPGRTVGTQPEVGLVQPPRTRCAGKPRIDPLGEAGVARRCLVVLPLRVAIVEKDEVEVRCVAELLPAELAVADDREARRCRVRCRATAASSSAAWPRGSYRRARTGGRRDARRSCAPPDPGRAGETPVRAGNGAACPWRLPGPRPAPRVSCSSSSRHCVPVWLGEQDARVEQLVEEHRAPGQVIGGPGRCAHQLREARQQRRVLVQKRQVRAAAADRFEQSEQSRAGPRPPVCRRCGCPRRRQ